MKILWFLGISFAIFRNNVATSFCTQAFSFLHPKISTPLHECSTTNSWFTSVPISRHSILHAKALVISSQHSILQAKALVIFSCHSILQAKSIGEFLLAFHSSSIFVGLTSHFFFSMMSTWHVDSSPRVLYMSRWHVDSSSRVLYMQDLVIHTHTHCNSLCNCSKQLCSLQRCSSTNEWHYCLSVSAGGRRRKSLR